MRNVWTIAKKEYRVYLNGPMAYVIAFVIFLTLGIFFALDVYFAIQTQQFVPGIQRTFDLFIFPLLFLGAPAITMRTLAEENRLGTIELMLTAPLRDWELVAGKWLGSFLFFLTLIAITLIYPLILNQIIDPGIDQGAMAAGYLGLILLTAAMCAVGVFVSSLFSNQLAALFASLGVIILLWVISAPADLTQGTLAEVLRYLSIREHFYNSFINGIIELKDVIYYLSLTALALFLGARVVETRRWR